MVPPAKCLGMESSWHFHWRVSICLISFAFAFVFVATSVESAAPPRSGSQSWACVSLKYPNTLVHLDICPLTNQGSSNHATVVTTTADSPLGITNHKVPIWLSTSHPSHLTSRNNQNSMMTAELQPLVSPVAFFPQPRTQYNLTVLWSLAVNRPPQSEGPIYCQVFSSDAQFI